MCPPPLPKSFKISFVITKKKMFEFTGFIICFLQLIHHFCFMLLVNSLMSACREAILKNVKAASVSKLPLPNALKEYLLYKT